LPTAAASKVICVQEEWEALKSEDLYREAGKESHTAGKEKGSVTNKE
jgi:hypothetical protein